MCIVQAREDIHGDDEWDEVTNVDRILTSSGSSEIAVDVGFYGALVSFR